MVKFKPNDIIILFSGKYDFHGIDLYCTHPEILKVINYDSAFDNYSCQLMQKGIFKINNRPAILHEIQKSVISDFNAPFLDRSFKKIDSITEYLLYI